MTPTIKQMAAGFKSSLEQLVAEGQTRSKGVDMIMSLILSKATGIDIYSGESGTLFHYQLVNFIKENVTEFRNEGLQLFYGVEDGVYWFNVKTDKHSYTISLPYRRGPFFDYSSNTLH